VMHARIKNARIELRGLTREAPRRNFQDKNCQDVNESFGKVKAATNTNTFRFPKVRKSVGLVGMVIPLHQRTQERPQTVRPGSAVA